MFDLGNLLSVQDIDNISLVGSDNLTLHTVAEKVEEYGFDPYDEDDVIAYFESSTTIKCSNQSGFLFSNITYLAIVNLSMVNCGQYSALTSFTAALHLQNIFNLSMEGVSIQNSTGYGVFAVNVLGQIMNSSFIGNNQYIKDMLLKMNVGGSKSSTKTCSYNTVYVNNGSVLCNSVFGGNMFLQYLTPDPITESLKLSDLLVALGVDGTFASNLSSNCTDIHKYATTGLGIHSQFSVLSAQIVDSVFYRNQAFIGANIKLTITTNSDIQMTNIKSIRGIAMAGGAGMEVYITLVISPTSNVRFTDSLFKCNYVEYSATQMGSSIDILYSSTLEQNATLDVIVDHCNFSSWSGFSSLSFGFAKGTEQYVGGSYSTYINISNSVFTNTDVQATSYSIYVTQLSNICLNQLNIENGGIFLLNTEAANIINSTLCNSRLTSVYSNITLSGILQFSNSHSYGSGGALYLFSSTVSVSPTSYITFVNNSALYGGAIYMDSNSMLVYKSPCNVSFINNEAFVVGGAIYVQSASLPPLSTSPLPCFITVIDDISTIISTQLYFEGNYAWDAGSVLYGGNIDNCSMDCSILLIAQCNSSAIFDAIIKNGSNNSIPLISSDPTSVCPCEGCSSSTSTNKAVYPGQKINISFITVGQRNNFAPSVVIVYTISPVVKIIKVFRTTTSCGNYSIPYSYELENQTFLISTEGALLQTVPNNYIIEISILPCPPWFALVTNSCICNALLNTHNFKCFISNLTAQRTGNQWVGYTSNGTVLAVSDVCPFDYCTNELPINLTNLNSQCNYNRSDVLCGHCPQGLSMTLGTSQCMKCSHYHLFLIIPFALMGLALVIVLFALNLTVSAGTLNGMILYANIFRINDSIFFPASEGSQFLSTAIAWFNLDVGIETCFYDGMSGYAKTWLQFVFPVYLFSLVLMIIIAGRYSSRISKLCRFNAVPVLATLILLSYSKVLRTTITIFSSAYLDIENSSDNQLVWLYDGNIEFLGPAHTVLFLFGLLVLIFFISPYTILLLLAPCLQARSHWRCLHWINKIKPFLDCYQAPFKDKYRFWSGMLLLGRLPLYVLFVLENDPTSKLWGILIFSYIYAMIMAVLSVYKNWLLLLLELLFLVNMTAVTEAMLLSTKGATYSIIGAIVYLLSVCGVVIFHAYHQCKRISWVWPKKASKRYRMASASEIQPLNYDISNSIDKEIISSGDGYGSTEKLREPLLEDKYV